MGQVKGFVRVNGVIKVFAEGPYWVVQNNLNGLIQSYSHELQGYIYSPNRLNGPTWDYVFKYGEGIKSIEIEAKDVPKDIQAMNLLYE